jgi:hypothetical protein
MARSEVEMDERRLVSRLVNGPWLRGRDVAAFAAGGDADGIDALLAQLEAPGETARHQRVLRVLKALPDDSPAWAALLTRAERLCTCLGREWVGPDDFRPPAIHDANLQVFNEYSAVLGRMGKTALGPARRLLDRAKLPVNVFGYEGARYGAFGPKLTALTVIAAHGTAHDTSLLAELVRRPKEDAWVKVEATLTWAAWQPVDAAAAAVTHCLHPALARPEFRASHDQRLIRHGLLLAHALLAALTGCDAESAARSAELLGLMGRSAVPLMVEFCFTSTDVAAWTLVEDVLSRLDPRAYVEARRGHEAMGRGLSTARPEPNLAGGLSVAAGPKGASPKE